MLRAVVLVKMHKTIMGATHFFLVGYRWLPRAGGAGKCYKSMYVQVRWGNYVKVLTNSEPFGAGRPPRGAPLQSNGATAHFPPLLLIGAESTRGAQVGCGWGDCMESLHQNLSGN